MDVDRRTASPDFAAGEAQFFRKLRAAFSDLQAQCDNEKVSNQRSFERRKQTIEQRIHDLEFKCSDLARRKRELEDAERKASLELRQKRDEGLQCQAAHQESEERRRKKYSALLEGGSATNLRIVLTPRVHQDSHQSPEAKTGLLLDIGPDSLQSRNGREILRHVPRLGNGQCSFSEGVATCIADEAEQHSVKAAGGAALSQAQNSTEEQALREQSSESILAREMTIADENHQADQFHQTLDTTDVRKGKRKRFPTAKAQALGLDGSQSDPINNGVNKRRALTPRQAEQSSDNRLEHQQDWTPERQPRRSEHSVIETTRYVNYKGRQVHTDALSEIHVLDNVRDASMTITPPDSSAEVRVFSSDATADPKDVASSATEQGPDGRTARPRYSAALHGSPMISKDNLEDRAEDHRQNQTRHDDQSQTITRVTGNASAQQPYCFSRFGLALPSALHSNASHNEPEGNKSSQRSIESVGFGVIEVADIGPRAPKMSQASGNAKHPRPLTDLANGGNLALVELASRSLEAQDLAAARTPKDLESIARQAWDSCHTTDQERVQSSREDMPQPPESSVSPLTELSLTSTEESAHAGRSNSSQNATVRPKGPSALRPLNFGQLQRDSRKTLQDFQGKIFETARKSWMSPAPTRDNTSHESSSPWRPANRGAGGSGWARSSSVRETQGPLPEPVCLKCREKKRRCDRQKPRCEWSSKLRRTFEPC